MSIERAAFLLAVKAHKHQLYGDGEPYIVHLYDVVRVLHRHGHNSETLRAAAWLHDIIEDQPYNYHNVLDATNKAVADVVYAVTDELGKNRRERKHKTMPKVKANVRAQTVKLADWIANVERAIEDTPKMLQMYQKEYPGFADECRDDFEELHPMWEHLSSLVVG